MYSSTDNTKNGGAPRAAHIQSSSDTKSNSTPHAQPPSISLPKGGGAIRGIDEKFRVNSSNGTGALSIPLPLSPGRNKATPAISIGYNSGTGNSILGIGWALDLPSIQRKTDKQLPTYRDSNDVFTLAGAEDLVPLLRWHNNAWAPDTEEVGDYSIKRYRPRIEGQFARIECISHPDHGMYWRVTTRDNTTTFFGCTTDTRIADPGRPSHVFQWLPTISLDDKGNCTVYEYKAENLDNVPHELHEKNRHSGIARFANTYLKRVRYGNRTPLYIDSNDPLFPPAIAGSFLFELVFDFGEHDADIPQPAETPGLSWHHRIDAFSSYRSGFDIRTYRLLQRVLMFHCFDELNSGNPCLVRSLDFTYETSSAQSPQQSEITYLAAATQCGYILKPDNTYSQKTLPAVEFSYEALDWSNEVRTVAPDSVANLPQGTSGSYRIMDFYGEGIPGVFTEQGNGWWYKANLGDVDENHNVQFDTMRQVVPKPSFTGMATGVLQLQDLEANGEKQIVVNNNAIRGFFALTDDNQWLPFRHFEAIANIDMLDPNVRMIDLDGDGRADILLTEHEVFTWYASRGKTGFDRSKRVQKPFDEELGPAIVFADAQQTIFLADMSGDGLTDIVRIRNGEICYWPNLGYGHFGAKVPMSNAPVFDYPEHFNPAYIQLADISGTGTTDILYLGHNTCRAWLNLSGNRWSAQHNIAPFFSTEQPNSIAVVDLLGNGTSCIIWSSPLPAHAHAPMRYIDLMNGKKPHLMKKYVNNLGSETTLHYKSSTWFYLKDKADNTPWITKLPFPVHCVHSVEMHDRITGARFVSEYSFHHGYYDHAEREFRGFGRVDQIDTKHYEHWAKGDAIHIVDRSLHQSPVLTRTWFHTGAFIDRHTIFTQFSHEYWHEEMNRRGFPVVASEHLPDDARLIAAPGLPAGSIDNISIEEWREALRACKGTALRTEIFALDAPLSNPKPAELRMQLLPYSVATHTCVVELLQPRISNKHAAFVVKESEAITYHYERNPADPRIAHTLNIAIDELGNVLESASVVYGRAIDDASLPDDIRTIQKTPLITYTRNQLTNDVISLSAYRLRLPAETETFELRGVHKAQPLYRISDFENILTTSALKPYEDIDAVPPPGTAYRRLIEHVRTLYYNTALTAPLLPHTLVWHALPFETYKLAYTPELLRHIFSAKADDATLEALMTEGKFTHSSDANWWMRSGTTQYLRVGEATADARNRFFAPVSYTDPYGAATTVQYFASYFLLVEETEDAKANRIRVAAFNLRTLSPQRTVDANDNISEVLTDELGLVKAVAVLGKGTDADELTGLVEYSTPAEQTATIDFFAATTSADLADLGKNLLRRASMRFVYDVHCYKNSGGIQPAVAVAIVREQHYQQNNNSRVQISFEYSNGLGGVAMKKMQAEPGKAKKLVVNPDNTYTIQNLDTSALIPKQLRWLGTGRAVLNNKGNAVKQYEPYFSATHRYESAKELVESGVTPLFYYDPIDRLEQTVFPDGTLGKTVFSAWKEIVYDQNDTVADTDWYNNRIHHLIDTELTAEGKDPIKEQEAAEAALLHADTPSTRHFDTLGRTILLVEHNGKDAFDKDVLLLSRTAIDIEGNVRLVQDARKNPVIKYQYDLLGNKVYQSSMDAGERWLLQNIMGNPLRTWDSRDHEYVFEYDILHRPIAKRVRKGDGSAPLDNIVEKMIYGEGLPDDKTLNLRTKLAVVYDTAGKVVSTQYDFKGNLQHSTRRFATDYKGTVDWSDPDPDAKLEAETFGIETVFDALNRITQQKTSDSSILKPEYNEANLLERVNVTQHGTTELFVKNIDYNEKGQRTAIVYGSDVVTQYFYDKKTFRLIALESVDKAGTPLQNLRYTYDPVGNITHQEDNSVPTVFFNNQKVTGLSTYTYDALYRLIEATGREHTAQLTFATKDNYNDLPFLKQYSANDLMAWRNYREQYRYDHAGNIEQMRHTALNGSWTRDYTYAAANNRLLSTEVGADTYTYEHHPQHGFITKLPNLHVMEWNFRDELQAVAKQSVDSGTPETTYYVYDGNGERVRKITERAAEEDTTPSKKRERLYVGAVEYYREYDASDARIFERQTLHVMDDERRIAMIETRTEGDDGSPERLVRYQFSNLLGSACVETDATGRVISYEEFHPYGTTSYQAVDKDIKAAYKRYRFTGMERDRESGLEYHSARYYIPWLGRWLSVDPFNLQAVIHTTSNRMNGYIYAKSNPALYHDPDGLDDKKPKQAPAKAVPAPKGLTFSPSSKLKAKDINDMIQRNSHIPDYMKKAFSVKGNTLMMKDIEKAPVPVPDWVGSMLTAVQNGNWHVTTASAVKDTHTRGSFVLKGDYETVGNIKDVPGYRIKEPPMLGSPGKERWMEKFEIPPEKMAIRGETIPVEGFQGHSGKVTTGPFVRGDLTGSPRGDRGLLIVANRKEDKTQKDSKEEALSEDTILETLFHELAAHAGPIDEGIDDGHGTPNVDRMALDISVFFGMPSVQDPAEKKEEKATEVPAPRGLISPIGGNMCSFFFLNAISPPKGIKCP